MVDDSSGAGDDATAAAGHNPELKRPIDPKRVLKILEFKRQIVEFVESMLEPDIQLDRLKLGEELICRHDYDDVVQERFILKLCGYPLCSNKLTKEWKQMYHVSLSDKRIYNVNERKLFCSVGCMNTSRRYRDENIAEEPIWLRLDAERAAAKATPSTSTPEASDTN